VRFERRRREDHRGFMWGNREEERRRSKLGDPRQFSVPPGDNFRNTRWGEE